MYYVGVRAKDQHKDPKTILITSINKFSGVYGIEREKEEGGECELGGCCDGRGEGYRK